ncbi:MAG: hypothetical protein E7370_01555 [Clostridiales bacterium]|nr:hypothetical protein [Clostridiales bacterium]
MKRKKIVFVCTGNTCRSPMAELLLRNKIKLSKIKWWDVLSCGTNAEVNGTINFNAKAVLEECDIDCSNFTPKQLTQKIIERAEVVICMTEKQKIMLEGCGFVTCVKDICGFDIPDPYGGSVELYRQTLNLINKACNEIIDKIILTYKD